MARLEPTRGMRGKPPVSVKLGACLIGLLFLILWRAGWALEEAAVIHPPGDARQYLALTLDNHLRVLLISDPGADKAAASLDVGVGYFDDPPGRPGLAHFLEHMLFLGTRKYPHPSSYRDFISAHGGRDNAYTMAQDTNFYFDIDSGHLEEALDRFSQFFVAPLFNKEYVAREVKAVEAEYRLKLRDDGRRLWQVQKATSNPRHPFAKFSVGNGETLGSRDGKALRQALIRFYHRHYSANLMTLVVLGKEPLDTLRKWVTRYFSPIPDRGVTRPRIREPLFLEDQKGVWINLRPVRKIRRLRLSFPFPWQEAYYLDKPALLISHLLGHEGEGSLFQHLRGRGWADALRVGVDLIAGNEATLDVVIELTEEGQGYVSTITGLVFGYLELIRRQGLQSWIYEELRRMNELGFHYRETPPPLREVRNLARSLQHHPAARVLRAPFEFKAYDRAFLSRLLDRLQPDNMRLTLMAPGLPTSRTEPFYGTPYGITAIAPALLARWKRKARDPLFAIPAPNPFIPRRALLKPLGDDAGMPRLILEHSGLHLWHRQDPDFRVPRANLSLLISSPHIDDTPRHKVLARLYTLLVEDAFDARGYPATLAGLYYGLDVEHGALSLRVGGYDEKLGLLLDQLIEEMQTLPIDGRRFEATKARLRRHWENLRQERPYLRLGRELDVLLQQDSWDEATYLHILDDLRSADLSQFIAALRTGLHLDILAHGNLTATEARRLAEEVAERLLAPGDAAEHPSPLRGTRLKAGRTFLRKVDTDHQDHAVSVYWQAPDGEMATVARVLLLHRILKGPFFYLMRTRAQLGYVVFAMPQMTLGWPGLKFVIQSPTTPPARLLAHIGTFLRERLPPLLEVLGEDEFMQYRQGLISDLLQQDHSLGGRSQRYYRDFTLGDYGFDRRARIASEVARIGKQTLMDFFRAWLLSPASSRVILETRGPDAQPAPTDASAFIAVDDIDLFRRSQDVITLRRM